MDEITLVEWFTIKEAARYARLAYRSIWDAVKDGELRASQRNGPGTPWKVHKDDLDAWIRGEEALDGST